MFDKLSSIYQGWVNSFNIAHLQPSLQEAIKARLYICEGCDLMVEDWKWKVVNNFTAGKNQTASEKYFSGMKCSLCSCQTVAKVSSPNEHCPLKPLGKWNRMVLDKEGNVIDNGIPK